MSKEILFYIIDILKDTDEVNKFTRHQLEQRLKDVGVDFIDRHTIKKCIDLLNDVGFDIVTEKGKENKYYLRERVFEEWEIKLVCDMVCECGFISQKDRRVLVDKLKNFTGTRNRKLLEDSLLFQKSTNNQYSSTKYVINNILSAMIDNKKIQFQYCEYDSKLNKVIKEKIYVVSPYKLLLKNGHYYLLLNKDGYEDVVFYRVDRIDNVQIRDENREELPKLLGNNYELELNNIIKRRLYNYDGENIKLVMQVKRMALGEIVDNFYDEVIVLDEDKDCVTLAVSTTKSEGLFYWLMQHLDTVKVIRPKEIKEQLVERVEGVLEEYKK